MIRHPRRTVPATIVAVVLLALCVLVTVSVVQSLLGQVPLVSLATVLGVTSAQSWSSAVTIAVAVVLAVLGLVLLFAGVRPGKPTVLPLVAMLGPDGSGAQAGVRRNSLSKDLSTTATGVAGVSSADVDARRRSVTAQVTVAAADPAAVPDQVRQRLEARLDEIGPAPRPKVRVRTRRDKNT